MLRFFIVVLLYIGASASAVSAGLVSKFVPDTDKKLPFSAHATRNLKKAAINTATSTAANGGKVGRNALSAAAGAMVDAGAANVAQEIGRVYRNGAGDMSWLTHKVCHFVLGGGSAALRGEDPLSGAIGATIGEVVADAMIARALEQTRADVLEQLEDFRNTYGTLPPIQDAELLTQITFQERLLYERERIEQVGRLAAAGTAFVGRMDVSTADAAALNALEHNAIPSIDVLIENQGKSILDQLLAWERASIEQGVIEHQMDPEECKVCLQKGWATITFLNHPADVLQVCGSLTYKLLHSEEISAQEWANAGLTIVPVKKAGQVFAVISNGGKKIVGKLATKGVVNSSRRIERGRFTTVITEANGTVRKGMNVDAVGKHLKNLAEGKNPILRRLKGGRTQGTEMYEVLKDVDCLKKGQFVRLDKAHTIDPTFNPHTHIEVRADKNSPKPLFECLIDECGKFIIRKDK